MKVENDLISRSALIAYVKELPTYDATEDVAPVQHAKWIPCDNGGYYCSNCDSRISYKLDNLYCSVCGARMDGDCHADDNVGYVAKLNKQRTKKGRERLWKDGRSEKTESQLQAGRSLPGRTIRPPDK